KVTNVWNGDRARREFNKAIGEDGHSTDSLSLEQRLERCLTDCTTLVSNKTTKSHTPIARRNREEVREERYTEEIKVTNVWNGDRAKSGTDRHEEEEVRSRSSS
ncbi:hypothetical protein D0S83_28130, partial [Klebsiella pneumoniae]|nr:hypothetical protein [Klebsiella pneumoniae]